MRDRQASSDEAVVRRRLAEVLRSSARGAGSIDAPLLSDALGLPAGTHPRASPDRDVAPAESDFDVAPAESDFDVVPAESDFDVVPAEPDWDVVLAEPDLGVASAEVAPSGVEPPLGGADERARLLAGAFDPGRRGVRALAAVAVVVVAVAGVLAWQARPRPEPVVAANPFTSAEGGLASPTAVVVAVAGRVRRPGLVYLTAGARVADAIEAAGGALPGTDLSFVNLARKVSDGELIIIGMPPPGDVGGAPGGALAGGLVNLNTATLAQLDTLPGVGPVLAQRILDYRVRHGGFRSVAELRQVDGVGDARYEQLRALVTV